MLSSLWIDIERFAKYIVKDKKERYKTVSYFGVKRREDTTFPSSNL